MKEQRVCNCMYFAVYGHTAAELIVTRADYTKEYMGYHTKQYVGVALKEH